MLHRNAFTFPAVAIMTLDMFLCISRRTQIITNLSAKYQPERAPVLPSGRRNSIATTSPRRPTAMKTPPFWCLNHSLKFWDWQELEISGGPDEEARRDWCIDAGGNRDCFAQKLENRGCSECRARGSSIAAGGANSGSQRGWANRPLFRRCQAQTIVYFRAR